LAAGVLASWIVGAGCATSSTERVPATPAAPRPEPSAERAKVVQQLKEKAKLDDFDQMILTTDLDGEALKAFMAATEQRLKNLDDYDKDSKKGADVRNKLREEVKAAEAAGDAKKTEERKAELAKLDEAYLAYRTQQRALVLGRLSLEQQRVWAARSLQGGALRALKRAQLTDDQMPAVAAACQKQAEAYIQTGTMEKDPYLKQMWPDVGEKTVALITKSVLTKEQRAAVTPK
jgi:hypothetical protein